MQPEVEIRRRVCECVDEDQRVVAQFAFCFRSSIAFLFKLMFNEERLNNWLESLATFVGRGRCICDRSKDFIVAIALLNQTKASEEFDRFAHGLRFVWIETLSE